MLKSYRMCYKICSLMFTLLTARLPLIITKAALREKHLLIMQTLKAKNINLLTAKLVDKCEIANIKRDAKMCQYDVIIGF